MKNILNEITESIQPLSAENYKKTDVLTGGALEFFYEHQIGMRAGVILGSSDLSGKLDIIEGSNNQFTFEEIVEITQNQLDLQGVNVKVCMNGD